MLSKKENLLETLRGGNPDRFVNQFEAFGIVMGDPISAKSPRPVPGQEIVNSWGVTIRFQENTPGPFPVHDDTHKVVKGITKWKETVHAPSLEVPDEAWDDCKAQAAKIDKSDKFVTVYGIPGIFEQLHYLMGMDDTLMNFYEEPEAMHELIDYITNWKIANAKLVCKHIKPEAIIHHDDWGSQLNSFMSPEMFAEFIVPAYKKLYGFYKNNGVQLIVHHSDSYAANLVPYMIEMGIDIWQGCMTANNVPELVKKYGKQITFMGDINNGVVDKADWTPELIKREVERACKNNGKLYFIPCLVAGGPGSTYPGVYDAVSKEIERMSRELF
ncbi:methylcobalamin:coenzyme M methyltransferase [Oxobacter pfennigii]|uniref:Methylcobalamin:coenzyme M methyltransferase n=1 Tax=Oxobacter pfennigii TaxID=36849 RepID=A0A0P8YX16_9CLOT|nr:uroporphyrinogen decarboxylase family protein [Oxobacter pfennigii]KPU44270.1 methylcobalamin:coenzyme M methyltransferase [Oxobacter pfennigii]